VGVEHHGEELRQDLRAHAAGEGLAFGLVFLPVAFHAVAENFVEEYARGTPGENGRADERIRNGRPQQGIEVGCDAVHRTGQCGILGQSTRLHGLERDARAQVHPVLGLAARGNYDARVAAAMA
jgi:hypothetical protein